MTLELDLEIQADTTLFPGRGGAGAEQRHDMKFAAVLVLITAIVAGAFSPPAAAPSLGLLGRSARTTCPPLHMLEEPGEKTTSRRTAVGAGTAAAAAAAWGLFPWASGAFDFGTFTDRVQQREAFLQKLEREKGKPGGHSERVQEWLRKQSGPFESNQPLLH